jgi:hypothetical protein
MAWPTSRVVHTIIHRNGIAFVQLLESGAQEFDTLDGQSN